MIDKTKTNGVEIPKPIRKTNPNQHPNWDSYFILRVGRKEYLYDNEDDYILARDIIESLFDDDKNFNYIGVKAKNHEDSQLFQVALFDKGFEWAVNGVSIQCHKNFYARLHDKKIITCYHDPSIESEAGFLSLSEIRNLTI